MFLSFFGFWACAVLSLSPKNTYTFWDGLRNSLVPFLATAIVTAVMMMSMTITIVVMTLIIVVRCGLSAMMPI